MSLQLAEADPPVGTGRKSKTVLVVDDDGTFRSLFAEWLKFIDDELTVVAVEDGSQAVSVLRNENIDLVITDLRMPVMGGEELVLWLAESRPATPVIVISAHADLNTILNFEAKGTFFYDKPADYQSVGRTVRALLA